MQSALIFLLLLAFLGACIWFLHRIQLRRAGETAERTAPLPALDASQMLELGGGPAPTPENWQGNICALRENGHLDLALALSREHFPKTQAFQQAAIVLRQQIRHTLDQFHPADALLLELFRTAALADLFRTSSSHKPLDPMAALAAVRNLPFSYAAIGHLRLKLLNKSDVRALEQLWGNPAAHRHVEDVLGEDWLLWCRPRA